MWWNVSKKELTFFALLADLFKARLGEAGYSTINRKDYQNSYKVHIQGFRKKHYIEIVKVDYYTDDRLPAYHISFKSDQLGHNYAVLDTGPIDINDPSFKIDVDDISDNVIKFLGYIEQIESAMSAAHKIFKPRNGWYSARKGYNPERKRVTRSMI